LPEQFRITGPQAVERLQDDPGLTRLGRQNERCHPVLGDLGVRGRSLGQQRRLAGTGRKGSRTRVWPHVRQTRVPQIDVHGVERVGLDGKCRERRETRKAISQKPFGVAAGRGHATHRGFVYETECQVRR